MNIIELDADNIVDYGDIIDPDVSESIGREFYRGIVAEDEGIAKGALIWEYKNMEEDGDTDAEICFIGCDSKAVTEELLSEFGSQTDIEEVVSTFFEAQGLNDAVVGGLSEDGFKIETREGRDIKATVADLKPFAEKAKKLPSKIVGLDGISEVDFMQGMLNVSFHGKKGMLEDLNYIDRDWFDEKTSSCVITDGRISGMLLVHRFPSGNLMPLLFTAIGPDAKRDLLCMMVYSSKKAVENYSEDTNVIVRRHNNNVTALAEKLFAGRCGAEVVSGVKGNG